jgi:hypothetical protein
MSNSTLTSPTAELARQRAEVGVYLAGGAEIRDRIIGFVLQLAALTDEVADFVDQAHALDRDSATVSAAARQHVEDANIPAAADGVVEQLRRVDPDLSVLLGRVFLSPKRGRNAVASALTDLLPAMPPRA